MHHPGLALVFEGPTSTSLSTLSPGTRLPPQAASGHAWPAGGGPSKPVWGAWHPATVVAAHRWGGAS